MAPVTARKQARAARPAKAEAWTVSPPQPPAGGKRPRGARAERSAARREAILAAALDEFSARGFVAARLDDVARRAGIAKGTIYLYFRDKETLFTELIRSSLGPIVAGLETAPRELPLRVFAEGFVQMFVKEILGTRRRDVLFLVITEGPRFPQLAEIYHREVIKRALAAVRGIVQQAIERGEIHGDALRRFPQLLVAPGVMAVLWEALFARFEPLDVAAMMRAHIDLLFAALERRPP